MCRVARKRSANPFKLNPLSVALPFSFIDYYRKKFDKDVSTVAQLTHMNLKKKWECFRLVIKDNFYKALLVLINTIFLDPFFMDYCYLFMRFSL